MKRTIRNAVIRFSGRWALTPDAPRALALHEVSDGQRFADQIDRLRACCEIVSLDEALRDRYERRPAVALTFDDGYASWGSIVAPILSVRKLPATFFVCSGIPDLSLTQASVFARERLRRRQGVTLLDSGALRCLAQNPLFEIGSHSISHPDFGTLSTDEMQQELNGSKRQLENLTGRSVRYFAFPFGLRRHLPTAAVSLAQAAGYEAVFSYRPAPFRANTADFLFGRSGVEIGDPAELWLAVARGGYELPFAVKERAFSWMAGAAR